MNADMRQIRLRGAACLLWLLIFLFVCADVVRRPLRHNTTPTYRLASLQWWEGQDPYSARNHDGFFYFPQAAFLFTPFTWGPFLVGELLCRFLSFTLFGYALIRLQKFFLDSQDSVPGKTLLYLALLSLPSALASLRNAQFDLPVASLVILTAAEVAASRWKMATLWLCLAVALKPLGLVPLLLFAALYWKLIPRLVLGLLIVLALPFLHQHPAFVIHEYVRCFQSLAFASKAEEPRYSDLAALLAHLSIYPPDWLKTAGRLVAAPVFLGLGAAAVRRLTRIDAAWAVGALSAVYLMLFNPRTETCSFVFLGAFSASLALRLAHEPNRRWLTISLAFASLGFACDAIPYIHGLTDRWSKPLLAVLFLPVLIYFILRKPHSASTVIPTSREPQAALL
jgi:alpha-1,2-mannosyltransferase